MRSLDYEVACPKCAGESTVSYDEDGRRVTDACYACSNTGRMSAQEAIEREVENLARAIGVARAREVEDGDEEFGLKAGEHGLSLRDYRDLLATDYEMEARSALLGLPDWVRHALVRDAAPKPKPAPTPTPRALGTHQGCGGTVLYQSTATRGWRYCERCKQSSNTGHTLELEPESGDLPF